MRDYEELDQLATDYATLDLEAVERERLYNRIYQGTFEFLYRVVPLEVEGLEKSDVVSIIVEDHLRQWIEQYKPSLKRFRNYISRYARDASKNVFRDTRGANPSRRMYDSYQKIKSLIRAGHDPEEVMSEHLYHSGNGLVLVNRIKDLLRTELDPLSLSESIHGKDDDGKRVSLEDTLKVSPDEVFDLDRQPAVKLDAIPPRYRNLIEQLRPGVNLQLHEIDFGRPNMRLIDKLAILDTAFRLTVQQRIQ